MIIDKKKLILIGTMAAFIVLIIIVLSTQPSGTPPAASPGISATAAPGGTQPPAGTAVPTIEQAKVTGRQAGALRFPEVKTGSAQSDTLIGESIEQVVDYYKSALETGEITGLDFEVTYNREGLLSILFTGTTDAEKKTISLYVPMTFDLTSGALLQSARLFPAAAWAQPEFTALVTATLKEQGIEESPTLSPETTGLYLAYEPKSGSRIYRFIILPETREEPVILSFTEQQLSAVPVPLG